MSQKKPNDIACTYIVMHSNNFDTNINKFVSKTKVRKSKYLLHGINWEPGRCATAFVTFYLGFVEFTVWFDMLLCK